ncbi:MAG: InlB B-repeat-containing protein, partial [Eubacteriaceae bacterium]|nr:InlB B-repeat-containing protein [Eubacteriaceae bacterium]
IDYTVQHVINAYTEGKGILCHGDAVFGDAVLTMNIHAHPEQFDPWGSATAYVDAIRCDGEVIISGTEVSITMGAEEGSGPYAQRFCGIGGDTLSGVTLSDGAVLDILIDSDSIFNADGICPDSSSSGCDIIIGEGCGLDIDIKAMGLVTGIYTLGGVYLKDALLNVDVATEVGSALGIYSVGGYFELTDCNYEVNVTADAPNNASLAMAMPFASGDADFTEGYEPQFIIIRGTDNRILVPDDGVVNLFGLFVGSDAEGSPIILSCESIYSDSDRTEPVSAVSIGIFGYRVQFVENDQTVTKKVRPGSAVDPPADPKIYGFDFEGWYEDEDLKVPFDFTKAINSDTKVYAALYKVEYDPVSGSSAGWVNGSGSGLDIVIKRNRQDEECIDHFTGVIVSDEKGSFEKVLTQGADFTAESGSTVVKLSSSFLDSLKAGRYTLTVVFDDGTVPLDLSISVPSGGNTPLTGVGSNMNLWLILIGICAAALVMIRLVNGRRKNSKD